MKKFILFSKETVSNLPENYSLIIDRKLENRDWDFFLSTTAGGHHVQSSLWAQLKSAQGWYPTRMIVYKGNEIVAGAQMLSRRVALFVTVSYLTKGPVLSDPNDFSMAKVVAERIIWLAKQEKSLFLAVQPPNNWHEFGSYLLEFGFQPSLLELAPVASLILDLTPSIEKITGNLKRQTRQNIRKGEESGLTVREGTETDLIYFYNFHVATSKRQGFPPYPIDYYKYMWKIFSRDKQICLFIVEHENQPITGLLVIPFGDTVLAKILGWSGEKSNLRPNEAVFWHAIKWSKDNGYKYFDFEGMNIQGARAILEGQSLPLELQHSPDFFKLGFGGQVVIYPSAFELIENSFIRWVYRKISPTVGGSSYTSHLMDRLRKH